MKQLKAKFYRLGIPFIVTLGSTLDELEKKIDRFEIGTIVTDFSPLREEKKLIEKAEKINSIGLYLVDAHNIVPVWVTSDKREYAAYTIRPKINRLLDSYRDRAPEIVKHPFTSAVNTGRVD